MAVRCWWRVSVVLPLFLIVALRKKGLLDSELLDRRAHLVEILWMRLAFFSEEAQLQGCRAMAGQGFSEAYVPLRDTGAPGQALMTRAGGLEAALAALRRFPDSRAIARACQDAVGGICLFNAPSGRHAGRLGALQQLLATYRRFRDEPTVLAYGSLGCLFDFVPENRQRFGELGGIDFLIWELKRNYWNTEVALQVWYAFSSGTFDNEVTSRDHGLIELGISSMRDHPGAFRIREEVLQAFKALACHSQELREQLVQAGAAEEYVKAGRENITDNQLVALVCENVALLVGGEVVEIYSVKGKATGYGGFNETHRKRLVDAGAIEVLLAAVQRAGEMYMREKASGYDVVPFCMQALASLAQGSAEARSELLRLGAATEAAGTMRRTPDAHDVQWAGCKLLRQLEAQDAAAVRAAHPPESRWCSLRG